MQDRVILVTGGTGALGSAVAAAFLAAGARLVAATARNPAGASELQHRLGSARDRLETVVVDLLDPGQVEAAFAGLVARHGRLDALVCCAGGYDEGRVDEMEPAAWLYEIDLNLKTTYLALRAALRQMRQQPEGGAIVTVASRAHAAGEAGLSAYCAAKAAVVRLTEAAAAEVAGLPIRVNCLLPGILDTPANRQAMPDADRSLWTPTGDVARVVVFLCSEDGRAIRGASIAV